MRSAKHKCGPGTKFHLSALKFFFQLFSATLPNQIFPQKTFYLINLVKNSFFKWIKRLTSKITELLPTPGINANFNDPILLMFFFVKLSKQKSGILFQKSLWDLALNIGSLLKQSWQEICLNRTGNEDCGLTTTCEILKNCAIRR